jgi:hypothetical protein
MRRSLFLAPALVVTLVACGGPSGEPAGTTGSDPGVKTLNDGITLTASSPQRVTGVYADNAGDTIQFDLAKVNDDVYLDVTGNGGRPILHIETNGDEYDFRYMGGGLTMRTTKAFVAQVRSETASQPSAISTDGFAFSGDMSVIDEMMKLPEIAQLPKLSYALGLRGITGSDYPASLALHKIAQQSAQTLHVDVQRKIEVPASTEQAYCTAYPNRSNDCYGMCGPGCSCWSWVCGDCCYHWGCAVHDSWCRKGEWWWCDDITAVVALFGC